MRVEHDINIYLEEGESIEGMSWMSIMDGNRSVGFNQVYRADHIRLISHDGKVSYAKSRQGPDTTVEPLLLKLV